MKLERFEQIEEYLKRQSRLNMERSPLSPKKVMERTKLFFELLGNPQERVSVIHIAGTVGKSSTAFYTSRLLTHLGFKTGLYISPHVLDLTEMIQIDGVFITTKQFVTVFHHLEHALEQMEKTEFGGVSNFEILTAMAYLFFAENQVDYAVVETGWGGLCDATNVVENRRKIAVLTRIGLDHQGVLGETVEEIAVHKLGIVHSGNVVVSGQQLPGVKEMIEKCADELGCELYFVDEAIQNRILYKEDNLMLAERVIGVLGMRDTFNIDKETNKIYLLSQSFVGRLESFNIQGKMIILDGAHNRDGFFRLSSALKTLYDEQQKKIFYVAFKEINKVYSFLENLSEQAGEIWLGSFATVNMTLEQHSQDPYEMQSILQKQGFEKSQVIIDYQEALKQFLASEAEVMVVTGSLYLISEFRKILIKGM